MRPTQTRLAFICIIYVGEAISSVQLSKDGVLESKSTNFGASRLYPTQFTQLCTPGEDSAWSLGTRFPTDLVPLRLLLPTVNAASGQALGRGVLTQSYIYKTLLAVGRVFGCGGRGRRE